jgi:mannosyltransferase OCH1-like enzyme
MKLYNDISTSEGKKDYVSLIVLQKYGGIFMDVDYTCVKPLDELAHRYSFFTSLYPPLPWSKLPVTSLSIIGSRPQHPIINKLRQHMDSYY